MINRRALQIYIYYERGKQNLSDWFWQSHRLKSALFVALLHIDVV